MKTVLVFVFSLVFAVSGIRAQQSEIFKTNGQAIKGFDAVAFFTDSAAVKGADNFSFEWKGATWLFVSEAHRKAFMENPEKYAPQYGGYCAYGTADGHKAPTETDTWTLVNGKLYFNYNSKVKGFWMKNQPALIQKADVNWPLIKDKE
jgi:YHS domain-containing protein